MQKQRQLASIARGAKASCGGGGQGGARTGEQSQTLEVFTNHNKVNTEP